MVIISIEEQNFKEMLKQALLELFEEQQDVSLDPVAETLADAGGGEAFPEGETSATAGEAGLL